MSSSDSDEYDPAEEAVRSTKPEPSNLLVSVARLARTASILSAEEARYGNSKASLDGPCTKGETIFNLKSVGTEKAAPSEARLSEADEQGFRLHGIKGRVRCICLSPSGSLLCAGGEDGQLLMWDFAVPLTSRHIEPTRVLTPFVNRISGLQPIVALHAAVNGSYFVACQDGDSPALIGSGGRQLGYCAIGERGMVNPVQCKGHRAAVTSSSPHATAAGSFYTAAQDGTARLWDQTSFERHSVYTVKHGTGQIDDVIVVESVLSLSSIGGGGSVFATGGQDGCVQLWDSRIKYRPGGCVAWLDIYKSHGPGLPSCEKTSQSNEILEKHVGGMAELSCTSAAAETKPLVLAVRRDAELEFVDLRKVFPTGSPSGASAAASRTASCMPAFASPVTELPFTTDVTPVVATQHGFLTCTSRQGFRHVVGGHVVYFGCGEQTNTSQVVSRLQVWRAGRPDEDVLCLCADAKILGSGGGGGIFAGLSSGDVVVQTIGTRDKHLARHGAPFWRWLASRPEREKAGSGKGECRFRGQKSTRAEEYESELLY